ncbi:MAG: DUF971 domain-containing protein [Deltaproteobacteria bacterium]|nr:DUF971 domain-containing protein [Deltaproteobacteria bacterium]
MAGSEIPTDIRRLGKHGVEIVWRDGHRSEYTNHELRQHCPCAACRARPQHALPVVGAGGAELFAVQIGVVGRYAISIQWSDGHDTGIYSYRTLRGLCPCPACRTPAGAEGAKAHLPA